MMKFREADRNQLANCMLLKAEENGAGAKSDTCAPQKVRPAREKGEQLSSAAELAEVRAKIRALTLVRSFVVV